MDRKEILNQKIKYEHKSDRKCEKCLGGDNRFNNYTLIILTGNLKGKKYVQFKYESL